MRISPRLRRGKKKKKGEIAIGAAAEEEEEPDYFPDGEGDVFCDVSSLATRLTQFPKTMN
jgi:hypothetical protein